ncbi:MAG: S1C family serine protease [Chitinophagales bacterium]
MKKLASNLVIAILGGLIALSLSNMFSADNQVSKLPEADFKPVKALNANPSATGQKWVNTSNTNASNRVMVPMVDFASVANGTTSGVVHIKTKAYASDKGSSLLDIFGNEFFGNTTPQPNNSGQPQDFASGSGVIIDPAGYIVTNYHVIEGADVVNVTLNDKRELEAKLVGTDPTTDLAVLKIETGNVDYIPFGNSDQVNVGDWVMAVGNPFNLASTVTAGIVSAKARNINILKENFAIESFIQTDAAVNSGNSGGALVNLQGELIGVNTAIATPTGYFAGYSFAVPVNIVKKVVRDLIEYGSVKRGFLGVSIRDVDSDLAANLGLTNIEGVFIDRVSHNSAAYAAGLEAGDIITKVQGNPVNSSPELQEQVGRYRPNDAINVTFKRNRQTKTVKVKLKGDF